VNVSAEGSADPDKDSISYVWHFGKDVKPSKEAGMRHRFDQAGDYEIYVEVKDDKGGVARSESKFVYAGNETPRVNIELPDNPNFYFPGKPVKYKVTVNDKEDGGAIDPSSLYVKVDYVSGEDKAQVVGHQIVNSLMEGKALFENGDCKTCHKVEEKSIGPALSAVAGKYSKNPKASQYLVDKIIKGGGGVWGETAMAAHPDLKPADAQKIVNWVMSLHATAMAKSLVPEGVIVPTEKDVSGGKDMQISATYTDKGGAGIKSLTGGNIAVIKSPILLAQNTTKLDGAETADYGGQKFISVNSNNATVEFGNADIKGISSMEVMYASQSPLVEGYIIEAFEGTKEGKKIGEVKISGNKPMAPSKGLMKLNGVTGGKPVVFKIKKVNPSEGTAVYITGFRLF